MTLTFEAARGIHGIDSMMCGRRQVTSCYLIEAEQPALVETGPSTSLQAVREGLDALGIGADDLAHIVVTHIHLDHAGGAGSLAPHYPAARVWVHERGAPHLADPTKLVSSAIRVYGEQKLNEMFGQVEPVPADRLRSVGDGDTIGLGNRRLDVLYTPGHASHHVALADADTGAVFVGDALGVFLPDVGVLRPASPPPEFDLEMAIRSIELIAARRPPAVLFSHFGPNPNVAEISRIAIDRLRRWTEVVEAAMRTGDELPDVTRTLRRETADELAPQGSDDDAAAVQDRYELLSSYEMNAMGLMRYIQKRTA